MSFLHFTLFVFVFIFFHSFNLIDSSSTAFVAPVEKDESTELYIISIFIRTPLQSADLILDLGGKLSWIDCTTGVYTSTTHHYIPCGTDLCDSIGSIACSNCFRPSGPGCHNNSCGLFPENPVIRNSILAQALVDSAALTSTDGRSPGQLGVVPNFVLSCSDDSLLQGLPKGVSGLAGLGRSNVSLPAQVSSVYASPNIFALCLPNPSSPLPGSAFFNFAGPYYFSPGIDLSSHLVYTPLILNPVGFTMITYNRQPSDEYFIGVTSIAVNGKPVEFNHNLLKIDGNGFGGTRLSTVTPYTVLETSIYKAFTKAFINESAALNLTETDPVDPFDVCYAACDVLSTRLGPAFPTIDLVMHSDDVFWRIFGANSMVKVATENGDRWCLGFVNGGDDPRTSVVIGGHQMEDNLLQFDLVSERLGFSSSVLVHNTNCAGFNFTEDPVLR
ncbi:basic 7S globulin-like [Cynara cardunculus var. scolymus]|uniref:basic 7S globulin-like n=1 Tax=Cynara cardunculus var. scolymus TaxID=59895 RepID=UPI000D62E030|nr:basic 7S globulin-like [Cynara cardunculus var. scolymus]